MIGWSTEACAKYCTVRLSYFGMQHDNTATQQHISPNVTPPTGHKDEHSIRWVRYEYYYVVGVKNKKAVA
ncbi:hypothetical protein TWF191_005840 [Orbilia oligospora]|uniref:Uncharacterized protein n=1 Tax=Orbilia oligospora TaxID=2813651 RepID=A0A7C8UPZ8_ORBOL|nr:hypothetical protein TWF191_005840 [Orbilia oligospora]